MAATTLVYSLILLLPLTNPSSAQLISSISASPSSLPAYPSSSSSMPPALSPDLMPVFPSPKNGGAVSSPEGSLPTIPSNPSPPNPDGLEPHSAIAPLGSDAVSPGARGSSVSFIGGVSLGLLLMWWLELGLAASF